MIESAVLSRSAITRAAFDGMDRIGQPDVGDARRGEDLGLTQLGAADADGAGGNLLPGDARALVRLGVRPQRAAAAGHEACMRAMLRIDAILVDDDGRCRDIVERWHDSALR